MMNVNPWRRLRSSSIRIATGSPRLCLMPPLCCYRLYVMLIFPESFAYGADASAVVAHGFFVEEEIVHEVESVCLVRLLFVEG